MRNLAAYFGDPQESFKSIHIAGTNGKGSVSIKTARALAALGYRTGLYTSPHISTVRERMQVFDYKSGKDPQLISKEDFVKWADQVWEALESDKVHERLSFFSILTMMAFLEFRHQKCEYVVLECGLGGRLDATNIVT